MSIKTLRRIVGLCLFVAALLSSCMTFDKAMEKSDLAAAEKLAEGLKGEDRRAAFETLAKKRLAEAEPKGGLEAARLFLKGESPQEVLKLVLAKGELDGDLLPYAIEAIKALEKSGESPASLLDSAKSVAVKAGGLRDGRVLGDAEYEKIIEAAGIKDKARDLALGEVFLRQVQNWSYGTPPQRKALLIKAVDRFQRSGDEAKTRLATEKLADVSLECDLPDEAAGLYEDAGKDRAFIDARLGDYYSSKAGSKNLELALEYYRRAGRPEAATRVLLDLGRAYLAAGKLTEALAAFNDSGLPEKAWAKDLAAYFEVRKEYSKAAEYFAKAGEALRERDNWEKEGEARLAKKDFEGALESFKKAGSEGKAKTAMLRLGDEAKAKANYPKALEWYEKAAATREAASLYEEWARAESSAGRHDGAAERFRKAGNDYMAREEERLYGEALLEKGEYSAAYPVLSGQDADEAFASLVSTAGKRHEEAEAEAALIAAGLPKEKVWEALAEGAYEAGESLVALGYYDKLGDRDRVRELAESAADEAAEAGRLDEAYKFKLGAGMSQKDAREAVINAALAANRVAEARKFLEGQGMKGQAAASAIADLAYTQGAWEMAAPLYAELGKREKAADCYGKAADDRLDSGEWEAAFGLLSKSGLKPSEAYGRMAARSLLRDNYEEAIGFYIKAGLSPSEAAKKLAAALVASASYSTAAEILKNHGFGEKEGALVIADLAAAGQDAKAAADYYLLAGQNDKAKAWREKELAASLKDRDYERAMGIYKGLGYEEKKAAELIGDSAAKAEAAMDAVKYYELAGLASQARPWYEKAAKSAQDSGQLKLALEYATKSGQKALIDEMTTLTKALDEMVAHIEEKGIQSEVFVSFLTDQEKRYGTKVVVETLKNGAYYYMGLSTDIILNREGDNLGLSAMNQASAYANYATVLTSLFVALLK